MQPKRAVIKGSLVKSVVNFVIIAFILIFIKEGGRVPKSWVPVDKQ